MSAMQMKNSGMKNSGMTQDSAMDPMILGFAGIPLVFVALLAMTAKSGVFAGSVSGGSALDMTRDLASVSQQEEPMTGFDTAIGFDAP